MHRLIWGFAGRTYHILGNLMPRLICSIHLLASENFQNISLQFGKFLIFPWHFLKQPNYCLILIFIVVPWQFILIHDRYQQLIEKMQRIKSKIILRHMTWFISQMISFLLNSGKCTKILTLVACQNAWTNIWRSSLTRLFPVCHCDKHFVNSSHENQHFICKQKEKSVQNFRTFSIPVLWHNQDFFCTHRHFCLL